MADPVSQGSPLRVSLAHPTTPTLRALSWSASYVSFIMHRGGSGYRFSCGWGLWVSLLLWLVAGSLASFEKGLESSAMLFFLFACVPASCVCACMCLPVVFALRVLRVHTGRALGSPSLLHTNRLLCMQATALSAAREGCTRRASRALLQGGARVCKTTARGGRSAVGGPRE
jgi:hypothetical protein